MPDDTLNIEELLVVRSHALCFNHRQATHSLHFTPPTFQPHQTKSNTATTTAYGYILLRIQRLRMPGRNRHRRKARKPRNDSLDSSESCRRPSCREHIFENELNTKVSRLWGFVRVNCLRVRVRVRSWRHGIHLSSVFVFVFVVVDAKRNKNPRAKPKTSNLFA